MPPTLLRAPTRIRVINGQLRCPVRGRVRLRTCRACGFLQGSLESAELQVLCGFGRGAALHRPTTAQEPLPR